MSKLQLPLTTLFFRFKLILIFHLLVLSSYTLYSQESYFLDQSKTKIEILDTTQRIVLEQMIDIFINDTINFPKNYLQGQHHLEEDEYEINIHDLENRVSFNKRMTPYSKMKVNKTSDYWEENNEDITILNKEGIETINGFVCQEKWVCTKKDTSIYWVAEKLPFIRYTGELPWGIDGFVMRFDTKWHPHSKQNDVRLTISLNKKGLSKRQIEAINKTSSILLNSDSKLKEKSAPCDSLKDVKLVEIPKSLAAKINEIVLPFQTRYKPPVYQFFEIEYLTQKVKEFEYREWSRKGRYTLRRNKMTLDSIGRFRRPKVIKVKLGKNDKIKSIRDEKKWFKMSGDTIMKVRSSEYGFDVITWQHYDYKNRILTSSSPYHSSPRNKKPTITKYYILHFSADSLVSHRGEGVHKVDFRGRSADQCKKWFRYNYDDLKRLISIYDENRECTEHQFCYYSNGLVMARYSSTKYELQGDGYVYYDYNITALSDGTYEVQVIEKWPSPLEEESTETYTFDKNYNVIRHKKLFYGHDDISTYLISYK